MNDDLGDDNLDLGESNFDEFDKKPKTLADLWRDNPLVKVGIVGGAAVVIFGTIMLLGGEEEVVNPSYVPAGSEITAPPGTEQATPAYVAAVEEENEARVETAVQEGGSALPTPIEPPVGRLSIPEQEEADDDPLKRWRQLQEERLQREMEQASATPTGPLVSDPGQTEAQQALADAMSQQMQSILESQSTFGGVQNLNVTSPEFLEKLSEQKQQESMESGAFFEDQDLEDIGEVLVPAGEIAYAQLLTEANSDSPGPILAQIVSGPLAGSRVLGSFQVQKELLTLNFDTVIVDGVSIPIQGVALDPNTTLPAMATDVDHRYLQRVALPMAAAFVEGLANAVSESGLTTVSIEGEVVAEETEDASNEQEVASGIEEAGQELRDILDDMADDIEVLVRVEAGTPMGILFLQPVVENTEISPAAGAGALGPAATTAN